MFTSHLIVVYFTVNLSPIRVKQKLKPILRSVKKYV